MAYNQKTDESGLPKLIARSLLSSLVGIVISAALALILSAVLVKLKDPASYITPLAYAALFIGCLSCGFAVRKLGTLASLISGIGYVLCLWLASMLLKDVNSEPVGLISKLLAYTVCVAVTFLGAMLGKRRKNHVRDGKNSPTASLRRQLGRR